jgi:hypothetical protein
LDSGSISVVHPCIPIRAQTGPEFLDIPGIRDRVVNSRESCVSFFSFCLKRRMAILYFVVHMYICMYVYIYNIYIYIYIYICKYQMMVLYIAAG